jgi:probable phosphoglycerate mutase
MGRVLLVRHGESTANARRVWQGHADYPLSERGRLEAEAAARSVARAGVDAIWASPLQRAWATAERIAAATGHAIRVDDRLKEIDIGAASGLTHDEVVERFPERAVAMERGEPWAFPGQESPGQFSFRVFAVLDEMLALDATITAVTHGGVIQRIAAGIIGIPAERVFPFSLSNGSITEVIRDARGRLVLHRLNDTCHIERPG